MMKKKKKKKRKERKGGVRGGSGWRKRWKRKRLEKAVEEVAEKAAGESGRRESGWRKLEEVKKRKRLEKAVEDRLCCLRLKIERGVVRKRVVSVPRSVEIKPLFSDLDGGEWILVRGGVC